MTTPQTPTPAALNPLSEPAAALAIEASCRTLGLPSVRHNYPGYTAAAVAQRLTHTGFLAELLAAEVDDRHDRRIACRLKDARLPRMKRLTDFDPDPLPDLSPALLARLGDPGWITAGHPLVLLGDSGTGKTHLLIGVAVAAAEHDLKVRYTTAAALVNELVEAADHKALTRTLNRYARLDLLCLDLCRHRDYAEGRELRLCRLEMRPIWLGIVTGSRGTPRPCLAGGSGRAWPPWGW